VSAEIHFDEEVVLPPQEEAVVEGFDRVLGKHSPIGMPTPQDNILRSSYNALALHRGRVS
jgi:hypothetical protein